MLAKQRQMNQKGRAANAALRGSESLSPTRLFGKGNQPKGQAMLCYAVTLHNEGAYHFGDAWIEFFWAEDEDHAREQAEDMNISSEIVCLAVCPIERRQILTAKKP
jgi:hypothetical protein